jgi:ubiquinone/menaquinone biosynthesis C-methylase UbiE
MDTVSKYFKPKDTTLSILDIGSGTGRFSPVLANFFNVQVIGIEPSDKMRMVAETKNSHPTVQYVKGSSDKIPLENNSCDAVWCSMTIHHWANINKSIQEIGRVLKSDGIIFIRNSFSGRLGGIPFYHFFPSAMDIDNKRMPSLQKIQQSFIAINFKLLDFKEINQLLNENLSGYADRMQQRAISSFDLMSEDEIEAGMKRIDDAIKKEESPQPVIEKIGFLVFAKI